MIEWNARHVLRSRDVDLLQPASGLGKRVPQLQEETFRLVRAAEDRSRHHESGQNPAAHEDNGWLSELPGVARTRLVVAVKLAKHLVLLPVEYEPTQPKRCETESERAARGVGEVRVCQLSAA